jgi:hypothetical protein
MKRLVLALVALFCLMLPAAATVSAAGYNPLKSACTGAGSGSAACGTNGKDPVSGNGGILTKASAILATLGGIAAVLIIIVGGFRYITSGGDPQKAASARNAIIGAMIGLVIIAAAETIVVFVVSKL